MSREHNGMPGPPALPKWRAIQALTGIVCASAAAGAYDWRIGLALFGACLLFTAGALKP